TPENGRISSLLAPPFSSHQTTPRRYLRCGLRCLMAASSLVNKAITTRPSRRLSDVRSRLPPPRAVLCRSPKSTGPIWKASTTGTFFDCATILLLTTATLNRLRDFYPQGRFEVQRFRPNIVVEPVATAPSFVENAWIGQTLAIGDEVRLRITGPCGRCVMTTLAQGDLPKDSEILRTAVQHNQGQVGVYAAVERVGTIRCDDRVRLGA